MKLFIIVPLTTKIVAQVVIVHHGNIRCFGGMFVGGFGGCAMNKLLLALVVLFSFRKRAVLGGPLRVLLVTIPLILRAILVFFITCN